ncbi:MAG: hypothetical protein ACPIOQ_50085, partial [Promethearchaeia archaeon]
ALERWSGAEEAMDVAAGRLREWLTDAAGCGEPVRRQGSGCWGACINVSDIAPGESTCGVGCEVHDGAFRDQDILIDTNGLHVLERPSASAKSSGYARILERAREASALAQSDALSGAPTHDAMDAVDLAARKRFMRSTLSEPVWQPADCALRGHSTRQKRRILGLSGLGIYKRLSPVSTAQHAVNEGPLSARRRCRNRPCRRTACCRSAPMRLRLGHRPPCASSLPTSKSSRSLAREARQPCGCARIPLRTRSSP